MDRHRFEGWFTGRKDGGPLSSLVTAEYRSRECALFFPTVENHTYGLAMNRTADRLNAWTGGWNITEGAKRIMFVNGEHDPYLGTTVSAKNRPGGPLVSTPNVPVWIIKNGTNCNDVVVIGNKEANPAFATVITEMVAKMKAWVDEHPSPNWNQVGSALERVLGDGRETNEQLEELTWD
ncbi:hypothetical protein RJ55_06093 [Drechmeria coniospora]|nr:hypothetical protein RJ55_06093 [Drechmeria coniospora]